MATDTQRETNAEYHADLSALTNSAKEVFRESPALFHGIYIARTIPRKLPTPAMVLGSVTHTILLEPDRFVLEYTIAPESCRARSGKAWEATVEAAEASGTTPVLGVHVGDANAMAAAVLRHPIASVLLAEHGEAEVPIRWTDPTSGMLCKCRPDWLVNSEKMPTALAVDLKTAEDPSPEAFSRAAANYGYHRQAAWYFAGITTTFTKPVRFVFIVVGKAEPYDVFVYQLAIADIMLGEDQNTRALADMAVCRATGVWLAPGQQEIQILELPRWARGSDYE